MSLRLGTRGSKLALTQAESVAQRLRESGSEVEVVPVKTDDGAVGDKSRFVRGVDEALLAGEIDVGVHSAKDIPAELTEGVELAAVPAREDPLDAYCGKAGSLDEVPQGARIGTASLRRRAQLLALRPDLELTELRGNVDTRLQKLEEGGLDGIVLAAAGLIRLGREDAIGFRFEEAEMTPAPGQGSLALAVRAGDEPGISDQLDGLLDPAAEAELAAERTAVSVLDASCETPVGVRAALEHGEISISGFAGLPDGSEWVRDTQTGAADDFEKLGRELGERMAAAGATELLERARAAA